MEDDHQAHQTQEPPNSPNNGGGSGSGSGSERSTEPVRSRWTPKPEQILILESIFNSGMVNPPKDETVRIRKLLEKFGSVGDANVFYWFQNRRSRSRRRQRQIQAASLTGEHLMTAQQQQQQSGGGAIPFENFAPQSNFYSSPCGYYGGGGGGSSSSSGGGGGSSGNINVDDLYSTAYTSGGQMYVPGIEQNSGLSSSVNVCPTDHTTSNLHYQPGGGGGGYITVFINGVATEVPRGAVDMKGMFGQQQQDLMLVHSSGVPIHDFGFVLQHGESYFLVPRPT